MIQNVSYLEYVQYFQNIAENHVDIQHGVSGNQRFVRINVEDAFDQITKLTSPFLALESLEYSTKAVTLDQNLRILQGGFMVLISVKSGDRTAEDVALDKAMSIQTDIEAKMRRDKKGCAYPWLKFLDASSIRCYKVGPLFNNAFGWLCEFKVDAQLNLQYDATKWLS